MYTGGLIPDADIKVIMPLAIRRVLFVTSVGNFSISVFIYSPRCTFIEGYNE